MVRALASVLLLGMFPHASLQKVSYALPPAIAVSVVAPAMLDETFAIPALSASGVMLIDLRSGGKIYAKTEHVRRPIGSLTKMMTALILAENHTMDEVVRVPEIGALQNGRSIGLTVGQQFRLEDLMHALLISSANDVAYTLAIHHSGTVAAFVEAMNERAKAFGMSGSHFENPAGFDSEEQYSTPRDLTWLAVALLKKPELKKIVQIRQARVFSRDGIRFDLMNTNELLHSQKEVFGVKTGTTDDARECLVTYFVHDGREYLLVLLGSEKRYDDALAIIGAVDNNESLL